MAQVAKVAYAVSQQQMVLVHHLGSPLTLRRHNITSHEGDRALLHHLDNTWMEWHSLNDAQSVLCSSHWF